MRFRFFFLVPWWLAIFVFVLELAALIVVFPFWCIWKLWDMGLARKDDRALGIVRQRPPRRHGPGALGAYRDWADRHMMPRE